MVWYRSPGSYGLMGSFNPMRTTLKRLFKETDCLGKDTDEFLYRLEKEKLEKEKLSQDLVPDTPTPREAKVVGVAAARSSDPRLVKRSYSESVEIVWIDGYGSEDRPERRMIHGIASTSTIDAHNAALLSRGCILKVPVPLMYRHAKQGGPIGEVVYMCKYPKKIYIRAIVFDHEAGHYVWQKIERGEISALSCGFESGPCNHIQAEVDDVRFYDKFQIKEVSIVPNPANPDCHFEIFSDDDEVKVIRAKLERAAERLRLATAHD